MCKPLGLIDSKVIWQLRWYRLRINNLWEAIVLIWSTYKQRKMLNVISNWGVDKYIFPFDFVSPWVNVISMRYNTPDDLKTPKRILIAGPWILIQSPVKMLGYYLTKCLQYFFKLVNMIERMEDPIYHFEVAFFGMLGVVYWLCTYFCEGKFKYIV